MIEVTKIQNGPVAEATCERSDATRKRGLARYRKPQMVSRNMVQTRQAFERTRIAYFPSRDVRAGALGAPLPSTIKHDEEAVIAEVSTQLSEVVGVIAEPTLLAVHLYGSAVDGGLKPHSDIDLLVTVTVRLDETTRRALINDLLETSASPGESEILRAVAKSPLLCTTTSFRGVIQLSANCNSTK